MESLVKKRKANSNTADYSEAQFCRDHKFDYGFFNRIKNLRCVPSARTVKLIEDAFKKEENA